MKEIPPERLLVNAIAKGCNCSDSETNEKRTSDCDDDDVFKHCVYLSVFVFVIAYNIIILI